MKRKRIHMANLAPLAIVGAILALAGNAWADFTFGTPVNLGTAINSKYHENLPCISADGLELYFGSDDRPGNHGSSDIWVSTRQTTDDEWGVPENLGPLVNSSASDGSPALSGDGLELYFHSWRPGGLGNGDIWVSKRANRNEPWGQPMNVGPPVNTSNRESFASLSPDGLELYFTLGDYNSNAGAIFCVARRETRDGPWGEPVSLGPVVNSWPHQVDPSISSDGLALVFCDWWQQDLRPGGFGNADLWLSLRATTDGEWGPPVNLGGRINTSSFEGYPMISADGSTLYFTSGRGGGSGGADLWQAPILPIVDFDDDGTVQMGDLLLLIESWGGEDPLCDIAPMPWGDGVVDAADLKVLMDHWGLVLREPAELLAHWKLDEAEGTVAHDSVGTNDGTLIGNPIWRPNGGQVGGALELDGAGDGVKTGFVLDPMESPLSVFAWIKGGVPGQIILSQTNGTNWLLTEHGTGRLMSGLQAPAPVGVSLISQTVVTDGEWHRVGLVCDLGARTLYVDDAKVAGDTRGSLTEYQQTDGGLHVGAPNRLNFPGFWSGLIDDVQVYKGVVKP